MSELLVYHPSGGGFVHPTTAGNKHIPAGGASGKFLKYTSDGTAVWADDNDTVYAHPTTAGNKHVPAGGSSNQVLKYTSDGTAVWGTDADTVYTHPTTAGNKHVPAGGAADQVLTYDSAGTAAWAASATPSYLDLIRKNNLPGGKRLAYFWLPSTYFTTEPELQGIGWEIGDITEYDEGTGSYDAGGDAGGAWAEMLTDTTTDHHSYITSANKKQHLYVESDPMMAMRFSIPDVDDVRIFAGVIDRGYAYAVTGSDDVNTNSVGFLYSDTLDANIQFQTRKVSVGQTLVDTGVAPDASEIYDIELEFSSSGTSLRGRITDYEGNILFSDTSITTNLPAVGWEINPVLAAANTAGTAVGFRWYRAEMWV
jgi:hypothetical protein